MIRILHCLFTLRNAGAQSFIMNVYQELDHKKIQFDFLIRCKDEINDTALVKEIKSLGGHIFTTAEFPRHALKNYRELNTFFKLHAKDYSAIHVHANSFLYVFPLILAKKYGISVRILHSHNSGSVSKCYVPVHRLNQILFLRQVTHRIACSDVAGKWMFGKKSYLRIKNGINVQKYQFNEKIRDEVRRELKIEENFVIGNIGRFTKVKNHEFMVKLFAEYAKQNDKAILVFAGIGELEEGIREMVRKMRISSKVLFLGLRKDADRIYQAFDVFIMPSLYEGLPFTMVEAQTAGLPCIVSSEISNDAVVTLEVAKCEVDGDLGPWLGKLKLYENGYLRKLNATVMANAGFDVKHNIEILMELYCGKSTI